MQTRPLSESTFLFFFVNIFPRWIFIYIGGGGTLFVIMVFFISSFMVSNGLTPKVMVCVTGISSGIDCERTQGFVFSFSFASPHGAGCVSKSVEIVLVTRFEQITYLWLENFLLG